MQISSLICQNQIMDRSDCQSDCGTVYDLEKDNIDTYTIEQSTTG